MRFESFVREALAGGEANRLARIVPELYEAEGLKVGPDGNNVALEREVAAMIKNTLMYKVYMRLLKRKYEQLHSAIHGG